MAGYQFTKKANPPNASGTFRIKEEDGIATVDFKAAKPLPPLPDTENTVTVAQINTKYVKQKPISELEDINILESSIPSPRKRVVFVSLTALNACIDDIPSYILDESLFCFKAERAWFFPSNPKEEKESIKSIRHRVHWNERCLTYLQQKDENKLILWMEDAKTWKNISKEITQMIDIYFETLDEPKCYDPLQINPSWWMRNFVEKVDGIQSLYCDSGFVVVEEILECKLKFNPTMELLYQSNPTLIPMKGFDFEMYINQHYTHEDDGESDELDALETDEIMQRGSQVKMKGNDSANGAFNMKPVVKIDCASEHVIKDDGVITPFYDKVGQEMDIDSTIYCHNSDSKSKYISEEDDRNMQRKIVHANST
eukprot:84828_1